MNRRTDSSFFVGLALLIIGIIFLLRNFELIDLGRRWWALFFLIPISYLLTDIMRRHRADEGRFPYDVIGSLIGVATLVAVMLIFLLNLGWGTIWPVFIIIGGLSLLLRNVGG